MKANIDPIRPTESALSWFVVNRDGMLVGALVAAAIVALMLIARMIGHRIVARETESQIMRLAKRAWARAFQDHCLLHGHGGDRHRRDLCPAARRVRSG